MTLTNDEVLKAEEELQWWTDLGKRLGLGQVMGWTFKQSALFVKDNHSYSVGGMMLEILLELDKKIIALKEGQNSGDKS